MIENKEKVKKRQLDVYNVDLKDMVEIATTDKGKARIRVVCYYSSDVDPDDTTLQAKAVTKYTNVKHLLEINKIELVNGDEYEVEVKNSAKGDLQVSVKGSENVAERYHEEFKKGVRT